MAIKVIVVGGGASGIVAAIVAARNGAEVVIIEKMNRIGKKLLATGNGRCNLTNNNLDSFNLRGWHSKDLDFPKEILKQFTVKDTIEFFEMLGIAHKVEEEGKVFPFSDQASSVLDVLRYELDQLGVVQLCEAEVKDIAILGKKLKVITWNNEEIVGDRVIIATGGKASPNLGSNGSGYELAKKLGHSIVIPFPALVQLRLEGGFFKAMKGIKFNGEASIYIEDEKKREERGEILFTDYGISGPPILQLSRWGAEALEKSKEAMIKLDFFPDHKREELLDYLQLRLSYQYDRPFEFSFVGLLNKRLIPILLKKAGINDINKRCCEVSNKEIEKITDLLKAWTFKVIGTQSWMGAQTTAGGVNVEEISSVSLESKLVKGLYFSGEILDVDGDCGGYNLQWAWSSGYVAGKHASLSEIDH